MFTWGDVAPDAFRALPFCLSRQIVLPPSTGDHAHENAEPPPNPTRRPPGKPPSNPGRLMAAGFSMGVPVTGERRYRPAETTQRVGRSPTERRQRGSQSEVKSLSNHRGSFRLGVGGAEGLVEGLLCRGSWEECRTLRRCRRRRRFRYPLGKGNCRGRALRGLGRCPRNTRGLRRRGSPRGSGRSSSGWWGKAGRRSGFAEFVLKLPDHIRDEIVETPADAVGCLLHFRQPLVELRIQPPRLAAQQGSELIEC